MPGRIGCSSLAEGPEIAVVSGEAALGGALAVGPMAGAGATVRAAPAMVPRSAGRSARRWRPRGRYRWPAVDVMLHRADGFAPRPEIGRQVRAPIGVPMVFESFVLPFVVSSDPTVSIAGYGAGLISMDTRVHPAPGDPVWIHRRR